MTDLNNNSNLRAVVDRLTEKLNASREASQKSHTEVLNLRSECERLEASNKRLAVALQNLISASGHMSPFGSESSVKNVRLAGKYMAALDAAKAILTHDAHTEDGE